MAKYTPGPWKYHQHRENNNTLGWNIFSVQNGNRILSFEPDEYGYGSEKEVAANVKLMAAAPELLQCVKQFMHAVEHEGVIHGRVVDAHNNALQVLHKIDN